ncbi:transport Sec61 subunit gamma-1 [Micractinium conductrix]|uniref:Transport Sec61 subunit gamma-1 n=1 Tax=Micractinium conductrix TaxID=554055 RepID=A0A2P6VCS4_9CHLO|nr:transport Sec61 subunit gamma-1 [Micractinium conductrix]|eukprot:PSC71896.1 transport Sec61 subunit gamma-1 [Micractinium conductrix]
MESAADSVKEFAKNSVRLVKRCQKPDRKEFGKVARLTAMGFVAVGLIGFLVKVIFIPINQIIIGTSNN